jgi:hypothetical protein
VNEGSFFPSSSIICSFLYYWVHYILTRMKWNLNISLVFMFFIIKNIEISRWWLEGRIRKCVSFFFFRWTNCWRWTIFYFHTFWNITIKQLENWNPFKILKLRTFFILFYFFFIILLFICAYKAWVISPPCHHPLPYHPLCPLPLPPPPQYTAETILPLFLILL